MMHPLEEWATFFPEANNLYTQYIFGYYGQPVNETIFQLAQRNLVTKFKLIGLVDRWPETLAMFKLYFGWNVSFLPEPKKVNPERISSPIPVYE